MFHQMLLQAATLRIGLFVIILCSFVSCKNSLYYFDIAVHCDTSVMFPELSFLWENTNKFTLRVARLRKWEGILAGTLVFGPALFVGFLASISYLWLALFFILVLQPQWLEWKLCRGRSDKLDFVLFEYCRVVVVTLGGSSFQNMSEEIDCLHPHRAQGGSPHRGRWRARRQQSRWRQVRRPGWPSSQTPSWLSRPRRWRQGRCIWSDQGRLRCRRRKHHWYLMGSTCDIHKEKCKEVTSNTCLPLQ